MRPAGTELFHASRRTNMTKLIVVFRKFSNTPKKNNYNMQLLEDTPETSVVYLRHVSAQLVHYEDVAQK
jgi:hypothetical protein